MQVSPSMRDFAEHHLEFSEWLEEIEPGVPPDPFIGIWARGGGKSTMCEHAVAYVGEQMKRRFALYVCETQDAANKHVSSIQTILEGIGGPVGSRLENQYGYSKGWRQNMVRTAHGFNVVPYGLDVASRGVKLDEYRPDFIIFDDVDGRHDSVKITRKKYEMLTESILPTGSEDVAILGVQNLIIATGIFSLLIQRKLDFLARARISGPHPAIRGLKLEERTIDDEGRTVKFIVGGEPTWKAQTVETCQNYILNFGFGAFDREMQHNVLDVEGALWTTETLALTRIEAMESPRLSRRVVAVDPATTSKTSSNETGIIGCGRTPTRHGYILADQSGILTPAQWGRRAVRLHDAIGADCIVAEKNQGGEMVESTIRNAAAALHREGLRSTAKIRVKLIHAVEGKRARAEPVAQMYQERCVHHVGEFPDLEVQMTTWNAADGSESPDRIDALVLGMKELGIYRERSIGRGYVSTAA